MTVTIHALPNGMSILLEENHVRPVISFNALVKVGSAFETDEEAGMCHVIEHMLFKGTPTYPVGEIAKSIEASGGDINAYTSLDQTVYYINMASRFAEKGLAILTDAIQHPLFDAEELQREKEVILEEIRRGKDNPAQLLGEELFKLAYTTHPYGRPIIGFPKTVTRFRRQDLIAFHRRWYSPRNIVFIVVGDFDTLEMLDKIKAHFAEFEGPPPPTSAAATRPEPAQESMRLNIRPVNIQNVHLALAWHVPSITHRDVPAIDVAAHILGGTDSSRLEQEVKERKRLVHHISSYAYTPKDPGLLTINALLGDAHVPQAIEAILHEIRLIQDEPVQAAELSRAKLNIRSGEIYEKETVGGQGGKLAYFLATAGSHEFEQRYYQMLQDVRISGVRSAARDYLPTSRITAMLLVPTESRWAKDTSAIETALKAGGIPARARPRVRKEGTLHRMRLKNGAILIVGENHNLPLVAMNATVPGGLRYETHATNGITTLVSRVITKGTNTRSAVRIAKDIEKIAGNISGFSGRNAFGLRCEFLSEHLRDGFELFSDILTHPAWSRREVANEKRIMLHAIRDQEDSLGTMAFVHFLEALFPRHPYGLRTLGTAASVKSISGSDIAQLYKRLFRPSRMIVSVVGDVSPHEIEELADELLTDLPKGKTVKPRITKDEPPAEPRQVVHHKKEKQQAHIALGFQGTTVKNNDHYAFAVLNNILAGQGGRLFLTLRDQMGLAYVVSSMTFDGIEPGFFAVYMGTEPAKIKTAIDGIKSELTKIITTAVEPEELDRAKQYIVGSYELDQQRNSALATSYALNEFYGLGIAEVERYPKKILAVTRDDVLRVARKYFDLDAPVISIIRPE